MKVSVIVSTSRPPEEHLERLVTSLDAQTLAGSDFEVLFVDSGSPDSSLGGLEQAAERRPNTRLIRMQNAGSEAKPLNRGIHRASGEYVTFLGQDGELYPDALRSAYEFASAHGSDVLTAKECVADDAAWGLEVFSGDHPRATGLAGARALLPLTTHKLYRRDFLLENDIQFPEDRGARWLGTFFNVEVAKHAPAMSILSSSPFHLGPAPKESAGGPGPWGDDYWHWLSRALGATERELSRDLLVPQRDQLLAHQYGRYVLGCFDDLFINRRSEARAFVFEQGRTVQQQFQLSRLEPLLQSGAQSRSQALERGDINAMAQLIRDEALSSAHRPEAEPQWTRGRLALDLASDLIARDRGTQVTWPVPVSNNEALIDPESSALGAPLPSGCWDLLTQTPTGGAPSTRPIAMSGTASICLALGRLHLAFPDPHGQATLLTDAQFSAPRYLSPASARVLDANDLEVALTGTHEGSGDVPTVVGIDLSTHGAPHFVETPATLHVADGTASVRFRMPASSFRVQIGDRSGAVRKHHVVTRAGDRAELAGVSVRAEDFTPLPAPASLVHRGRTGKIRVLLLTNNDSDNVGDQLIEASAISLLRGAMKNLGIPEAGFEISSRAAGIIPKSYLKSNDESLLKGARRAIRNADLIVFGGAPLFNYRYQVFYLRTIRTLELAQEYNVPVLFSSIGVEPFDPDSDKSRALQKALQLPVVRQITTRDDLKSVQEYVAGTRIPTALVSDPAVFVDLVFRQQVDEVRAAKDPARRKLIGLVVTRAGIFKDNNIDFTREDQRQFWLDVVADVKARGYDYRLLTTGHFSDEAFIEELVKSLTIPKSHVAITVNSPEELINELAACDGVVAYRLHASIASFALGVPSIGLSWNFKVPYFYESVGLGDRALGPEDWTADKVVSAIERAMDEGVPKDEVFLMTVYETLFAGIKALFAPESRAQAYSYQELCTELPAYSGTTSEQYRAKLERKMRRTYEGYRKVAYRG